MRPRSHYWSSAALVLVTVLAAVLLLTSCGSGGGEEPAARSTSLSTVLEDPSDHLHQVTPDQGVTAEQLDPVASARKVLETWARPDVPYAQWWAELEPLLNPQGRQNYAETDPALVPALTFTSAPRLEESTVDTSAVVWFPTDAGEFGVRLSRTSGDSPWLASRIYFPGTAPSEL